MAYIVKIGGEVIHYCWSIPVIKYLSETLMLEEFFLNEAAGEISKSIKEAVLERALSNIEGNKGKVREELKPAASELEGIVRRALENGKEMKLVEEMICLKF